MASGPNHHPQLWDMSCAEAVHVPKNDDHATGGAAVARCGGAPGAGRAQPTRRRPLHGAIAPLPPFAPPPAPPARAACTAAAGPATTTENDQLCQAGGA